MSDIEYKHYHVYMGGSHGFMYGESTYTEPDKSIRDFLALSDQLFGQRITTPVATTEYALHFTAAEEINQAIYIEGGPLRVVWMVCDGTQCFTNTRN